MPRHLYFLCRPLPQAPTRQGIVFEIDEAPGGAAVIEADASQRNQLLAILGSEGEPSLPLRRIPARRPSGND